MEYAQLQSFFAVVLTICAGVVTISGMVAVVVKFWKWAHKDTDKNTEDISEFRIWLASDKHRIEDLEKKQDIADEQNKLLLEAVLSIMTHELDGNNTTELKETKDKIQKYLIKSSGGIR